MNRFHDENLLPYNFYKEAGVLFLPCAKKVMAKVNFETKTALFPYVNCGNNIEKTKYLLGTKLLYMLDCGLKVCKSKYSLKKFGKPK